MESGERGRSKESPTLLVPMLMYKSDVVPGLPLVLKSILCFTVIAACFFFFCISFIPVNEGVKMESIPPHPASQALSKTSPSGGGTLPHRWQRKSI